MMLNREKLLYPGTAAVAVLLLLLAVALHEKNGSDQGTTPSAGGSSRTSSENRRLKQQRGPVADPATLRQQEAVAYARGETQGFKYYLRDEEGNFDPAAARQQGFSDEEATQIASLYQKARSSMAENFKSRIEEDPGRSDPEKSVKAYKIKSAPEAGDKISASFRIDLAAAFGPDKAEEIYAAFRLQDQFGCFGRQEIRLKMTESPESEIGYMIQASFFVPEMMIALGSSRIASSKDLHLAFGTAFDGP